MGLNVVFHLSISINHCYELTGMKHRGDFLKNMHHQFHRNREKSSLIDHLRVLVTPASAERIHSSPELHLQASRGQSELLLFK